MSIINLNIERGSFPDDETYAKACESSKRHTGYEVPTHEGEVDIKGLDKIDVIMALYHGAKQVGMGFLQPGVTEDEVRVWVDKYVLTNASFPYVDYLGGRPLKVRLGGDTFDPRMYDRDWGDGAAQRAVDGIGVEP